MTKRWLAPLAIALMAILAVAFYPVLPEQIPTHWNLSGEVDGWTEKPLGAFLFPLLGVGLLISLLLLRRVDPRRENYHRFEGTFWLIINVLVLLLAALQLLVFGSILEWPLRMENVGLLLPGILFVILGNYLPRVRSNWWIGIRTPWTLSNDRVWRDTHRVGGRAFVVGGLLLIAAVLLPRPTRDWLLALAIGGVVVVPLLYSYMAWRREQRRA